MLFEIGSTLVELSLSPKADKLARANWDSNSKSQHMQVTSFVKDRIAALRREHPENYNNITAIRTNSQKYLVNYFAKGQLTKLFFLFPVRPSHPRLRKALI